MTTQLRPAARRRNGRWLEILLVLGLVFSLLTGAGALAGLYFVYTAEPPSTDVTTSAAGLDIQQIAPQLALMELAGDPAAALAYQALNAGELATAHAMAAWETDFAGSQRMGFWQELGRRYGQAAQTDAALAALNHARTLAILDNSLTPQERTAALIQVAEGQLAAGATESAQDTLEQAMRMGQQVPDFLPAQRSQIFTALQPLARQLDNADVTAKIDELVRNPYLTPPGVLPEAQLDGLGEPLPEDPTVTAARQTRELAAHRLAERITYSQGVDIEPERQALVTALVQEDQVRAEAYRRLLSTDLTLGQLYHVVAGQRSWVAQKVRVANQAYGMSLIPDWEANRSAIENELATETANLDALLEQFSAGFATPVEQANFRISALYWLATQAELGLYPGAAPSNLDQRIQAIQSELTQQGAMPALPIRYELDASPPGFRIQPTG